MVVPTTALTTSKPRRVFRRLRVQRNLSSKSSSKSSLDETKEESSLGGSTVPTVTTSTATLSLSFFYNNNNNQGINNNNNKRRRHRPRQVHFSNNRTTFFLAASPTTSSSSTASRSRNQHHNHHSDNQVVVQVQYIPTKEELDIPSLYYSRQELHEMLETARAHARIFKRMMRLVDIKFMTSSSNKNKNSTTHDGGPQYESLLRLYKLMTNPPKNAALPVSTTTEDDDNNSTTTTTNTITTSDSTFRGLERWILELEGEEDDAYECHHQHNNFRKLAIQRILQVQDTPHVDRQQCAFLMRMRSLLESRKACHFAQRVGATDALEAQ